MEKINIAELLKGCPSGMELDCYLFNGLEFDHIDTDNENYPIVCRAKTLTGEYNMHSFTKYGWFTASFDYAKCVIFPKGKTTWEGFHRPFEDGDIVVTDEVEWYSAKELNEFNEPNKEETMEKEKNDWAKWDLPEGYEFQDKEGNIINTDVIKLVKKQPHYPKTYEECCKVLGCKANHFFTNFSYDGFDVEISDCEYEIDDLLQNFRKLIYCRNAYWKIAGEQMGLGKPWEPLDAKDKYIIRRAGDAIVKGYNISCVLEFPTAEMKDAFYEHFKELINKCKELL
jgi:hypothetical protein